MNNVLYSGSEAGKLLSTHPLRTTNTAFTVAIPSLPSTERPIVDDASGACVGYVHEGAKNVWRIFDMYGQFIRIGEAPLETPIVDPYNLILIGPAVIKLVRTGFSTATRLVAERTAISATSKITGRVLPLLRRRLLVLSVKRLQFTETAAKHMANPGRFVPIHILHWPSNTESACLNLEK